ncbi:hypothetical protein AB1Y20_015297 [Prymnesium parvum]|uniref:ABM domain-containing protein n=1 Tax=Prymnesium parvum TaxID=97485 RepID=A0AB34K0F9_PRYPA
MGGHSFRGERETQWQCCIRTAYTFSPSIAVLFIFIYLLFMPETMELQHARRSNRTLVPIEERHWPPAQPAVAPSVSQYVHIVDYKCKPGTGEWFKSLAAPLKAYTKKFEGQVTLEVLQHMDDSPDEFRVIERHVSKNAMRGLHMYGPFATFKHDLALAGIVIEEKSSSWSTQLDSPRS